ncbi:MAG: RNA pseudouridine synthase [Spirochaetia bacterium]|nr:RNA pseudouridine synthase [Spirochaetia bacterium]
MENTVRDRILYEDNHLIVVNKLPSEIVQADETGDTPLSELVKEYLRKTYHKPGNIFLGVPHRLDRPTSGIVLFAKTDKALTRLGNMFRDKKITKTYWAIVDKMPPDEQGELKHYLVRNRKKNKSFASDQEKKDSQFAHLSYRVAGATTHYYMLEIILHTGRHHQIRAQLAAIGCTIKGDLKYGAKRSNKGGGIYLHARKVEFEHPTKKEPMIIVARPPLDPLWDCFVHL